METSTSDSPEGERSSVVNDTVPQWATLLESAIVHQSTRLDNLMDTVASLVSSANNNVQTTPVHANHSNMSNRRTSSFFLTARTPGEFLHPLNSTSSAAGGNLNNSNTPPVTNNTAGNSITVIQATLPVPDLRLTHLSLKAYYEVKLRYQKFKTVPGHHSLRFAMLIPNEIAESLCTSEISKRTDYGLDNITPLDIFAMEDAKLERIIQRAIRPTNKDEYVRQMVRLCYPGYEQKQKGILFNPLRFKEHYAAAFFEYVTKFDQGDTWCREGATAMQLANLPTVNWGTESCPGVIRIAMSTAGSLCEHFTNAIGVPRLKTLKSVADWKDLMIEVATQLMEGAETFLTDTAKFHGLSSSLKDIIEKEHTYSRSRTSSVQYPKLQGSSTAIVPYNSAPSRFTTGSNPGSSVSTYASRLAGTGNTLRKLEPDFADSTLYTVGDMFSDDERDTAFAASSLPDHSFINDDSYGNTAHFPDTEVTAAESVEEPVALYQVTQHSNLVASQRAPSTAYTIPQRPLPTTVPNTTVSGLVSSGKYPAGVQYSSNIPRPVQQQGPRQIGICTRNIRGKCDKGSACIYSHDPQQSAKYVRELLEDLKYGSEKILKDFITTTYYPPGHLLMQKPPGIVAIMQQNASRDGSQSASDEFRYLSQSPKMQAHADSTSNAL